MKKQLLVRGGFMVICIICSLCTTQAQTDKIFWFAVPEATEGHGDSPLYLRLTTQQSPATVRIYQPANATFTPVTVNIAANSVNSVNLTAFKNSLECIYPDSILNRGLKIESTDSITAYFEEASYHNPEIYALKGLNALGQLFYVPGQRSMNNGSYNPVPYNSFDIVATEDNTKITITPSEDIVGHTKGVTFTIVLNKGQCYSARATSQLATSHLGGSKIVANKSIAVSIKDDSIKLSGCYDLGGDQLIPVDLLGQEYICVNGFLNSGLTDKACIMAVQNNTTVTINGAEVITLNEGQTFEKNFSGSPIYIKSNKPVSVMHITGNGCELGYAVIPQIGCTGSNTVGITRADNSPFNLIILMPAGGQSDFKFNNQTNVIKSTDFNYVPNTANQWMYARISINTSQLPAGQSALVTNPSQKFHLGILFGDLSSGCSYGYFSNFASISPNIAVNSPICEGDTLKLLASPNSPISDLLYEWTGPGSFFSTAQNPSIANVTTDQNGNYFCKVYKQGCFSSLKFIPVTINSKPKFIATVDSSICYGNAIHLNSSTTESNLNFSWIGPNGFTSTQQNPVISSASGNHIGNYKVTATKNSCSKDTTLAVTIKPAIIAGINGLSSICENDTLNLIASDAGSGAVYNWSGPNGFVSGNANVQIPHITIAQSGLYSLTVTKNGCSASISTAVTVKSKPTVVITGNNILCEGSTLNLAAAEAGESASYSWASLNNFASTSKQVEISNIAVIQSGTYSLTVTKDGCSTSTSTAVTIKPKPTAVITGNNILCEGNTLHLTATDAGNGASYSWESLSNFTSTSKQIEVSDITAVQSGTYSLTVTKDGCSTSTSTAVTIKPKPTAVITGNNILCEGSTLNLAAAEAGESASYSWASLNNFASTSKQVEISNIAVIQSGTYSLTVTKDGCSTSTSTAVTIKPKPTAVITGNNILCEGSTLNLTATDAGDGASYSWTSSNNITSGSKQIEIADLTSVQSGTYSLTVTKDGCSESTSTAVTIKPKPTAVITGNNILCEGSTLNLAAAEAGESASYSWASLNNFASTSKQVEISNIAVIQSGTYSLTVTKDGCSESTSTAVTVKPNPVAFIAGNNAICIGEQLKLSASSSLLNSQYQWIQSNGVIHSDSIFLVEKSTEVNNGLYTLIATANGCTSQPTSIYVNIKKLPESKVVGLTSVCEQSLLQLTAVDAGENASYEWLGPNSLSFTGKTLIIDKTGKIHQGSYKLIVSQQGCTSNINTNVEIKALPQAKIHTVNTICEESPLYLKAIYSDVDMQCKWNGPNEYTATGNEAGIANSKLINSGLYTLTVTNNGCTNQVNTEIIVKARPTLQISGATTICEGEDVQINTKAITGVEYNWSGPLNFITSSNNILLKKVSVEAAGSYMLHASKDGCYKDTNIVIHVNPLPTAEIIGNNEICEGSALQLTAKNEDININYTWKLPNETMVSGNSVQMNNVMLANAGIYRLTVNKNGCVKHAIASVTIKSSPIAAIDGTTSVCEGASINLKAANMVQDATYEWTLPGGGKINNNTVAINSATIQNAGEYTLTVSKNGCTATKKLPVSVKILMRPIINGATQLCEGSALDLLANAGSDVSYTWIAPNGIQNNTNILHVNDPISGLYKIIVVKDGCRTDDSAQVVINKKPLVQMQSLATICQYAPPFLVEAKELTGLSGSGIFKIEGSNLSSTGLFNPTVAGTFNVNYTYNAANGCSDTYNTTIKVVPGVKVNAGQDKLILEGQEIKLEGVVYGSYQDIQWHPLVGEEANKLMPIVKPISDQAYTLVAKNEFGCFAKDEVVVKVAKVKVPNAFSPNGDGLHDKWQVEGLKNFSNCEVEIFNRYGVLVYSSKGYNQPWDGTYKDQPAPTGTYYYLIRLKSDLRTQPYTGWIQLLR